MSTAISEGLTQEAVEKPLARRGTSNGNTSGNSTDRRRRREWKPGDVAVFAVTRWPHAAEWPEDTSRVIMRLDKRGLYWNAIKGDPSHPFTVHVGSDFYRPLVVIDPEDYEQVLALVKGWHKHLGARTDVNAQDDAMQDALREFANPTPPKPDKPDEPTGLGAVASVPDGPEFVHFGNGCWIKTVPNAQLEVWRWDQISCDVRVLSEGVTA